MIIECISTEVSDKKNSKEIVNWAKKSELEITLGKTYIVIAISKYFNLFFYYILSDESDSYPLAFPSELFRIKDFGISKFWETDLLKISSLEDISLQNEEIISFKEWHLEPNRFYENLLEGEKIEMSIFINYRDKMLSEYRNASDG